MDTVVRSFADLHARRCECVYFLLGAGGAERALRARISRLAMRQDVTFMDEQSPRQVVGIFKAADIYISPDPSPRMDIRSLLAMAAGIPVLTCLDAEGYLIDGRTAVRFARDDSADLTTKLLRLVEDHDAARRIARGALDYLGEYHRSATMVAAVAQTYRQAVK